ncbi:hypothetical protein Vretifemale_17261 [Volvox reticuliferus]|uniref:Uncharacterized protein n=1 Tax=Volvox reticuliferus TaxID=1737510 RepID=A0A8J4CYR6_9CHLO|nr:hypothetical protein Vretifemale_17261 [Volvox reticuliferus]
MYFNIDLHLCARVRGFLVSCCKMFTGGEHTRALELPRIEVIKSEVENPALCYPDYYLKLFHARLRVRPVTWIESLAAFEVQPATIRRTGAGSCALCSCAAASPTTRSSARRQYVHRLAEQSPFADASLELRVLRPGGVLAIVDNNPKSATIQNLPPFLFTTMKSTEPWSDEYYSFDVESPNLWQANIRFRAFIATLAPWAFSPQTFRLVQGIELTYVQMRNRVHATREERGC